MTLNVRQKRKINPFIQLSSFIKGLRLVFTLLNHMGDISLLTQSLESFIVRQGLDNMLKNKDTIKQVAFYFLNKELEQKDFFFLHICIGS